MNLYNPLEDDFLMLANERKDRFWNRRKNKENEKLKPAKPKRAKLKPVNKWTFDAAMFEA